jgi:hypothetical protein
MTRFDRLSLASVVAVAALLRLPGIDVRGRFDVDQGRDMLVLAAMTRDGVLPLVGPTVWFADVHHGALYNYLLAPAAAMSSGDVVAVTVFIALLGIAAVGLTWWVGRAIGGPLAGFLAGLLLAVSPAAIESSTFIWNPNPIPVFSVAAIAASWRAHQGGHWAWWAVAMGAAGAVAQLHLLGMIFLVAIVALCLIEARSDRSALRGFTGGVLLIGLLFLPVLIHELGSGFSEIRGIIEYLAGGSEEPGTHPVVAVLFTLIRVLGSPQIGLVTDLPQVAAIIVAIVVGLAAWGLRATVGPERTGVRWLVGILIWSTIALALTTPSLQRVVVGFPNDHYHAFLYPVVALLIGIPWAGLISRAVDVWRATGQARNLIAALVLASGFALLVGLDLTRMPPRVDPEGGWPAARAAGERIVAAGAPAAIAVVALPTGRSADAVRWPITVAGGTLTPDVADATMLVVICDRYLEDLVGLACGGPAEDAAAQRLDTRALRLIERFEAPRQTAISIYAP